MTLIKLSNNVIDFIAQQILIEQTSLRYFEKEIYRCFNKKCAAEDFCEGKKHLVRI